MSTDFFLEILQRIPLQPLFKFRSVCKTWLQIIDNPSFTRSHAHRHRNEAEDQILIRNKSGNSYKLSLTSLVYSQSFYDAPNKCIKAKDLDISIYPGFSRIVPVASCDGLILFSDGNRNPKAIWNPLTREYLELLELPNANDQVSCLGFGIEYDVGDNDYKIASLSEVCVDGIYFLRTWVYSLKTDSWFRIRDFEGFRVGCLGNGVFVDGEVYWIGYVEEESVIALDFCTESYRVVKLPSLLGGSAWLVKKKLDVMGGCLFLSYFNDDGCLDLWMMKSFEGGKEWSRLFSFSSDVVGMIGSKGVLKPIAYLKSKDLVLVQHDQTDLIWLDVEKKKSKKVMINGLRKHVISQVFQESAVRLNESGRVAGVRSIDPAKRKPLKLSLNASDVWNYLDIWGDSFAI